MSSSFDLRRVMTRFLLGSMVLFVILSIGDYLEAQRRPSVDWNARVWVRLFESLVIGVVVTVAEAWYVARKEGEKAQLVRTRFLDITDAMARLSAADLSTFMMLVDRPDQSVESVTTSCSPVDRIWQMLVDLQFASRCAPGDLERAAPKIRRYTLTEHGREFLPALVVPAVRRFVR